MVYLCNYINIVYYLNGYVFMYLVVYVVFEDGIELKAYKRYYRCSFSSASLAQLIARWSTDREVPGSSPWCSVTFFSLNINYNLWRKKEHLFTHYPTMSNYCSSKKKSNVSKK